MKLLSLLFVLMLAGCGTLIPKKVEFFQDKVKNVPEVKSKEVETLRQAAARAVNRAEQALLAAISEGSSTNVVIPAQETALLTEAVSDSLGPPLYPSTDSSSVLAAKVEKDIARLNARLDAFKKDNNENEGKKIEGTGLFQIPYFIWLALCGVAVFVGLLFLSALWTAVKLYSISNPPLALGINAVQAGSKLVKRGFSEVLEGGEKFKVAVKKEIECAGVQEKVLGIFRREQEKAQSRDTQEIVKGLTI